MGPSQRIHLHSFHQSGADPGHMPHEFHQQVLFCWQLVINNVSEWSFVCVSLALRCCAQCPLLCEWPLIIYKWCWLAKYLETIGFKSVNSDRLLLLSINWLMTRANKWKSSRMPSKTSTLDTHRQSLSSLRLILVKEGWLRFLRASLNWRLERTGGSTH